MLLVFLLNAGFVCGIIGVVFNPSACFAAGALMLAAGVGCGILAEVGSFFLALVLYLVYLGGMLVVFAYSVAMSSDLYPEAWTGFIVNGAMVVYYFVVGTSMLWCSVYGGGSTYFGVGVADFESGFGGISLLYGQGGWMLALVGLGLLLTLLVVLELVRGVSFGVFSNSMK
uniref:NADH-ubiquinone oxidoreductase chain 6 n=1 Tax=Calotes mystaceus TaxID=118097 RepID=A0A7M1LD67_9SAUR|nr:NADH dehydrogenase subunit 6 [Calotes mystaceus]QOQ85771.1 NADH dehydrogenase subunit 6 [Calotes mystaceus]